MTKIKQEQEKERNPTLKITREKGYNQDGNRTTHDHVVITNLDDCGRVSEVIQRGLTTVHNRKIYPCQEYGTFIEIVDWSEDGRTMEVSLAGESLWGTIRNLGKSSRRVYDESGNEIGYQKWDKKTGDWKDDSSSYYIRDAEGRKVKILYGGKLSKMFSYDSQDRLERILDFSEGNLKKVQTNEYPTKGGIKITINPCGGELLGDFLACQVYGNSAEDLDVRTSLGKPNKSPLIRYIETRRERNGKDKTGKPYHASLIKGWLEDIGSGKEIPNTKFSKVEIEKIQ